MLGKSEKALKQVCWNNDIIKLTFQRKTINDDNKNIELLKYVIVTSYFVSSV